MKNITQMDKVRELGIIFSNDLSFNAYVDSVCTKALKVLDFMKRN